MPVRIGPSEPWRHSLAIPSVVLFGAALASVVLAGCASSPGTPRTLPSPQPLPSATLASTASPPTPLPSLTPTPEPPARFGTQDFESPLQDWDFFFTSRDAGIPVSLRAGFLSMEMRAANTWVYAMAGPHTYEDIFIESYFESRGTASGATGLVCRYDPEHGWYEFTVLRDGRYSVLVGKWLTPDIAHYTPVEVRESEYLLPARDSLQLGLACQGDTLWLHINGKLIRKLDVARYGLRTGQVGLTAASFEDVPVISAFDWFRVSEP